MENNLGHSTMLFCLDELGNYIKNPDLDHPDEIRQSFKHLQYMLQDSPQPNLASCASEDDEDDEDKKKPSYT